MVRVRHGFAAGARWTAFPWSAYWRGTHEPEIQKILLELGLDWERVIALKTAGAIT